MRAEERLPWKREPETQAPAMANNFISHSPRHAFVSTFSLNSMLVLRHDVLRPKKRFLSLTQMYKQIQISKNFTGNYASNAMKSGHWKQGIISFQELCLGLQ